METYIEDVQDPSKVIEEADHEKMDTIPRENVIHEAREAADEEHRMGLCESLKLYPNAADLSVLLSSVVVMKAMMWC